MSEESGQGNEKTQQSRGRGGKRSRRSGRGNPRGNRGPLPVLELPGEPKIISRSDHSVSRKGIDPDALKVMYRLNRNGHRAFLVGGGVRDLQIGKKPKDFDIGTDARPEEVRTLFRNSRIIGRRFRLSHIYFKGNKIIEVATFRSEAPEDVEAAAEDSEDAEMIRSDNTYGDPETDALRRDLTINGLFYDLSTFSIIDYVDGMEDLKKGLVRMIGEPERRFREDPVRMIRAIRHAARASFEIEKETFDAICNMKEEITQAAKARVHEEFLRELRGGAALSSFRLLRQTGLLQYLMPVLFEALALDEKGVWEQLERVLVRIDEVSNEGKELPASILFLSLLLGEVWGETVSAPWFKGDHGPALKLLWGGQMPSFRASPEEEDERSTGAEERRMVMKTARSSQLKKMVDGMLQPLGVSRKERERVEQLLIGRYNLLRDFIDERFTSGMERKSYFEDSMMLLRLTAFDDVSKQALEHWSTKLGAKRKSRPPQKKRRRRRRKPPPDGNRA